MVSYFSIILVFPQMFEEDFNVFVDIPEDFEIRDREKISLRGLPGSVSTFSYQY